MCINMDQGKLFNLVGTMLIIFATALHIVCLVTPHFSEADGLDVLNMQRSNPKAADNFSITPDKNNSGLKFSNTSEEISSFHLNKIIFGVWELCFLFVRQSEDVHICTMWSSETIYNSVTGDLDSIGSKGWLRAVQAMGIIGVLLSTGAIFIALINMLVVSKGDRLRLIHIFIATSCFASGGFLLLGNLIMAANFKDVILMLDDKNIYPPLKQWQEIFSDHSYLSWGFALDVVAFALAMLAGVAHLIGGRIVNVENSIV